MPKQTNPIWSFFSSVRLTIVLLTLIVLLSIAGTLIPQQEEAQEFVGSLSPGISNILQYLQIFDLYHSTIFYVLIWLLSMNLVVCSLNRLPLSWKQAGSAPFPAPADLFINLPPHQTLITDADQDTTLQVLQALLKTKFRTIRTNDPGKEIILFSQRGQLSHFGVYVVHMSILVIIAGAIIGAIAGFEAYVSLREGQSTSEILPKGIRCARNLDFTVRCDKFTVEFYENGMPKTYRSDLSFIKNGQVVYQGPVLVNHPLSFEKIRFYQSSYGEAPGGKAFLAYTKNGVKSGVMELTEEESFELPSVKTNVKVLRIEKNLMEMGPAVKLGIAASGGPVQFWVFEHIKEIEQMNPGILSHAPLLNPKLFKPYEFLLDRVEPTYNTGLQVVRDPGAPLVAAGGFLMVIGLLIALWMAHQRVWIWIGPVDGKTFIRIAGRSNRNKAGLEREIRFLCIAIKEKMKI